MNKLEEIKIRLENIKEKNINISKIKRKKCRKCKCVKTLYEKEYKKRFDESFLKKYLLNEKFKNFLRKCIGYHYGLIHCALVFYTLFCIVFVNNIVHLTCVLVFISMDALSNIVLYDCPLTMLEKKYLGFSGTSTRVNYLHKFGFMITNEKEYDIQLEVIVNAWCMCAMKLLILIVLSRLAVKI